MERTETRRTGGALPDTSSNQAFERVLVVDDQADVRTAVRMLLKSAGYAVDGAQSPEEALACLPNGDFAAALIDMNYRRDTTSGGEGLKLLQRLRAQAPHMPVIVMTAWASVDLAVEAMRQGAADFIEKPWQNARLLHVLETQVSLSLSHRNERRLSAANRLLLQDSDADFIAESPAMRKAVAQLQRLALSDGNLLLLGENGTGKSIVAQKIHAWSPRHAQSFIKVNLGGLAPGIFEAELFGHVRGAYTDAKTERIGRFELADGGTLFLDEIGNVPMEQQPKLLRVIEDGEFERLGSSRTQRTNVRLISATNSDLSRHVQEGRFRQDLLYRINTFEIRLPPLRERREDIVPLARHYLARAALRYRRATPQLTGSAERALHLYGWPGNVRELSHVMERAALLAGTDRIDSEDLHLQGAHTPEASSLSTLTLEQAEIWLLRQALTRHEGNLQRVADQLGITRQSLYRRLDKHGLQSMAGE